MPVTVVYVGDFTNFSNHKCPVTINQHQIPNFSNHKCSMIIINIKSSLTEALVFP